MQAGAFPLIVGWETPLHWAVSGALIAFIVLLLLFRFNHSLGVSTGLENVCALWSERPYFRRSALSGPGAWRLPFWLGLILGGVVSKLLAGEWSMTWDLGMWDQHIGGPIWAKVAWMFVGGLLIGFGTRAAGGCTSGHGIFGVSNLEGASYVSMVSFMLAGIATTFAVYHLFSGVGG